MVNESYRTVRVPADLIDTVEKVIAEIKLGYTSVADFVKDAVRRRLEEVLEQTGLTLKDIWEKLEKNEDTAIEIDRLSEEEKAIMKIIEKLEIKYEKGVPEEEIVKKAEEVGLSQTEVKDVLTRLKVKGCIYSPRYKHYKTIMTHI